VAEEKVLRGTQEEKMREGGEVKGGRVVDVPYYPDKRRFFEAVGRARGVGDLHHQHSSTQTGREKKKWREGMRVSICCYD